MRLSEKGEPLTKDGPDSAWQRLIKVAIRDGVISEEQRFSLHDLKRKGARTPLATSLTSRLRSVSART